MKSNKCEQVEFPVAKLVTEEQKALELAETQKVIDRWDERLKGISEGTVELFHQWAAMSK